MIPVRLEIGRDIIRRNLPQSFNELTPENFLDIVKYRCDLIDAKELFSRILSVEKDNDLPIWVTYELKKYTQYWDEMNEPVDHFIIPNIKLSIFSRKYNAPNRQLSNMSLQQFMSIDNFFQFYTVTHKEEFLYKMVACMYIRKSKDFFGKNIIDIDHETERFKQCDKYFILAAYLNWILIKNWLTKLFKHLFSSGTGDKSNKPTDWLDIFDSFIGDHVSEIEAYQRMKCMDAFRIMNHKIKQNKENE